MLSDREKNLYRELVRVTRRLGKSRAMEYLAKKNGANIQKPKEKVRVWVDEYHDHISTETKD